MANPAEIVVEYTKAGVTVHPETAVINWRDPELADTVNWIVKGCPDDLSVKIAWELEGPFLMVEEVDKGRRVLGRVNTREGGIFNYSVIFVNEKNQIVAGVDPRIKNEPLPGPISG